MRKKATPIPYKPKPAKFFEDVYMKDLERRFPDEDGRRLRGIARRLSKATDLIEQDDILEDEFGLPRRYERVGTSEQIVAIRGGKRGEDVQGDSLPTQGES